MELDSVDVTLLRMIQKDSTLSLADLAESVNLTTTPCWKRIKRFEELGIIDKRVALLNPAPLGLDFTAFVMLKTSDHSHDWYQRFSSQIAEFEEVMEFYRMAGEYDYMLKVVVADMQAYDHFYKKMVNAVTGIADVTSTFAMESIKYTTALPIHQR